MKKYDKLAAIDAKNNETVNFLGYEMVYNTYKDGTCRVRLTSDHYPKQIAVTYIIDATNEIRRHLGIPEKSYCYCSVLTDSDDVHDIKKDIDPDEKINPWSISMHPVDYYPNADLSYNYEYNDFCLSVHFSKNEYVYPSLSISSKPGNH